MTHSLVDPYVARDSLVHRLDPRTKLLIALLVIVAVALTPPDGWLAFAACSAALFIWFLISRAPPLHVLKRCLAILPFVLLIAVFVPFFKEGEVAGSFSIWDWHVSVTYSGLEALRSILIRASLSILSLVLLTSTTRVIDLLKGLEQLHMPRVAIMLLSFMYRYIFVLVDEAMRMKQARDSRSFGGRRWWRMRTVGNMIGTLFIRSYERGERVYAAMVARGFDGRTRALGRLRFKPADAYFAVGSALLIIAGGLASLSW